jgi:translation initiation factor IF-2
MKTEKHNLIARPPIVVIMGHVDHGKTTLLDYIRKTNVTQTEAGGITQHTSAYEIAPSTGSGQVKKITFIDTPGHAAFSEMRSRGARIADLAVLVISAVESVQVQTLEALRAIQDAEIPYIVALNKIDKPEADANRVKQDLAQNEIFVEGYGGSIPCVAISAKTGEGVPELIELILLQAELENLTAETEKNAEGIVVESHLDPKRGVSATLIIRDGTLSRGSYLIVDDFISPVRIFEDFTGKPIDSATVSSPVRIAGLPKIPQVGSPFLSASDKRCAELALETCKASLAASPSRSCRIISEEDAGNKTVVPLLVKADTLGTLEAVEQEIAKLQKKFADGLAIKILFSGAGPITENNMKLAIGSSNPIVIGFNVKIDRGGQEIAEKIGVAPVTFNIIYKLQEFLEEEFAKRLPKIEVEETIGKARILRIFSAAKDKQIVGGGVLQGVIAQGKQVKILRRDREIGRGTIVELQQQKSRVKEVAAPNQFGTMIESKISIAEGDTLDVFDIVTK